MGLICLLFHLMSMSREHGLLLCIILYAKEREGLTAWYKSGHMMHVNTYSDRIGYAYGGMPAVYTAT